ncbi:endophilin-B1-like isoform X2 [Portunus trituberculatus]|uniref:endophilin-B1-like isoform X2 n=1 Tax=Portunus trituberculatus TaxID=210409 RepID=UPI001E1CF52F|nr:endophilin-B1-like isoform X2 [Portunus trituberculatus]
MDLKKLAGQAGQFLTRAVQYTEEKIGSAEKTELDRHFESLSLQADAARQWTEKLVIGAEAVLIPNPGNRVEDMIFEKIEKRRPNRLSNLEYLGLDMVQAGNDFGSGTPYGSALLKVGGAEQRLGLLEREFVSNAIQGYLQPMRKFLDTEMKTITRERRLLETKRLDLDACKSRLRKARSMDGQSSHKDAVDPKVLVAQAEAELRKAQADFDRQTEITKLLLEGVRSSQAAHLRHLNELVEAQAQYYEQCQKVMTDLQKEMASFTVVPENAASVPASTAVPAQVVGVSVSATNQDLGSEEGGKGPWRRAKVVCDYDATCREEMSLMMNEVVLYTELQGQTTDFVTAKRGNQTGRVPRAYIEPLDD